MNFIDVMTECDIPLDRKAVDFFLKLGNYFIVLYETTEKDYKNSSWRGDVFVTKRHIATFTVHKNVSIFRHDVFYEDMFTRIKAKVVGYLKLDFPDDASVIL